MSPIIPISPGGPDFPWKKGKKPHYSQISYMKPLTCVTIAIKINEGSCIKPLLIFLILYFKTCLRSQEILGDPWDKVSKR